MRETLTPRRPLFERRELSSWPPLLRGLRHVGLFLLAVEIFVLALTYHLFDPFIETALSGFFWITAFIGPTWPFLLGLSAAAILSVLVLAGDALKEVEEMRKLPLEILSLAETLGPALGLLGTFIGLYQLLVTLDPKLSTQEIIALLTRRGGEAYGSSVVGIILQIFCHASQWLFDRRREA
jgi:hypothetical protein